MVKSVVHLLSKAINGLLILSDGHRIFYTPHKPSDKKPKLKEDPDINSIKRDTVWILIIS